MNVIPQGDPRHLDEIDKILEKPNLISVMEVLTPLAFFTDPVHGMPVDESCCKANEPAAILRSSIHLWHVAYFAMVALRKSNPHRGQRGTWQQISRLINHYNSYDMPTKGENADKLIVLFTRLAYQQFLFQQNWWAGMSEANFIYNESESIDGFSIPDLISELFGMRYNELLHICVDLYYVVHNMIHTNRGFSFTMDHLSRSYLPWVERDRLEKVLSVLAQTQREFRLDWEEKRNTNAALRKYDFNPLMARPFVEVNGDYYAPVPALILIWVVHGIWYRLLDYASLSGRNGQFQFAFGRAFEGFVENVLQASAIHYIKDPLDKKGKPKQGAADFIIIEREQALIFDCKTRRPTLKHKYGSAEAIRKDYEDVAKGLKQSVNTKEWILDGTIPVDRNPALAGVAKFSHAVVTLEDYYLANSSPVRSLVKERLDMNLDYSVFTGRELELMVSNLAEGCLIPFINNAITFARDESPIDEIGHPLYEERLNTFLKQQGITVLNDPSHALLLGMIGELKARIVAERGGRNR